MHNDTLSPESWGWRQDFLSSWAALTDAAPHLRALIPARVTGRERHLYEIVCPDFRGRSMVEGAPEMIGRFGNVRVSGRFEHGATEDADFPVVGDWALVDGDANAPRIQAILPRRSSLSRTNAGNTSDEQALASNIDAIFLVFALDGGRNFLLRFLERALVVARNSGASCYIVLNKVDLATDEERDRALDDARRAAPGVNVVALSAKTGEGVEGLRSLLSPGETACMLGKSGVGKSALVNVLSMSAAASLTPASLTPASLTPASLTPGSITPASLLPAKEGAVRDDDLRGRHTTTSSHLYRLDSGALLIDSPGIRELKLWGDAEGLEGGFPEIARLATRCRFGDCSHKGEPGCAVKEALDSGELDPKRYEAYLALAKEQAWIERRTDERARREDEQKWKSISKLQKELKRNRTK